MSMDFFTKSKLSKLILQEVSCKKLESPSQEDPLKINIGIGFSFDDKKTKDGYRTYYNISIKCEEDGEEKLFSFYCKVLAAYNLSGSKKKIEEGFEKNYFLFFREMYNVTREDINAILDKMDIHFRLPLHLPDGLKLEYEKSQTKND